jgi:acylphosphatase
MLKRLESGISARSVGFNDLSLIKDFADQFQLRGVIFTKEDGSIKIIAEGEEENLKEFTKELEKEEHSLSRVENFYEKWDEPTGEFNDFSIEQHKQ